MLGFCVLLLHCGHSMLDFGICGVFVAMLCVVFVFCVCVCALYGQSVRLWPCLIMLHALQPSCHLSRVNTSYYTARPLLIGGEGEVGGMKGLIPHKYISVVEG